MKVVFISLMMILTMMMMMIKMVECLHMNI
ncbi:hypothetical protein NC651_035493 [Populus alba x Populus x berolinensis]|nr:hypothetical protein NC651_035493 [Populus alba x Populus x berolinensis]